MLNRDKYRAASVNFQLLFQRTIQKGKAPKVAGIAELLCMALAGSSFEEVYRWFEGLPLLRHWIGDRQAKELKAEGFSVKLKPYEATIRVLRDDIMFDQLGGYAPTIRQMAIELMLHKWRESVALMQDGFSGATYGLCFDGYCLFSASHSTGSNTGTASLSRNALGDAIKAMRAQVDPTTGDNLLIEPTHLWYHPNLEETARDLLEKELILDATGMATESNKWFKALAKLPLQGMTSAAQNYWGLLSIEEGNEMRPALWRYMPGTDKLVALDADNDEPNFMRRELFYGIEHWCAAAPGFPQYVWGSNGTT